MAGSHDRVAREALELRHRIDRLSGLLTVSELADEWGLSRTATANKVQAPNFPSGIERCTGSGGSGRAS